MQKFALSLLLGKTRGCRLVVYFSQFEVTPSPLVSFCS